MEHYCKICSSYHNYNAPCFDREPVCPHGQLARQCRMCELEAEVAGLRRERDDLHQQIHDWNYHVFNLEDELTRMRPVVDAAAEYVKIQNEGAALWVGLCTDTDEIEESDNKQYQQFLKLSTAVRKLDR